MNTVMKQRLVGTVVIGCLAIIFIPILLDGDGVSPPEITTSIPDSPPLPSEPVIQQTRPEITSDTLPESTNTTEQEVSEDPGESEAVAASETAPPAPEQPRLNSAGIPATWTVRLGSFGEMSNAEALVGRLREGGYRAFSRPLQTSRGQLTGVYVGPVMTEAEAGSLQQALADAFELEGVVVQFGIEELEH